MGIVERTSENNDGQKQTIISLDKIVKIDDKFLEVRLIQTEFHKCCMQKAGEMSHFMPRARFVNPDKDQELFYLIDKEYFLHLKENQKK